MYSIREHSEIREGGIVDPLQIEFDIHKGNSNKCKGKMRKQDI